MRVFVFEHEVLRANNHALALKRRGNAVRHDVFHGGVAFAVFQPALLRGVHHGARHGVGEVLFQAGGEAKHFLFGPAVGGKHAGQLGLGFGQRARLVEHDGVGLGEGLEILRALHHNARLRGVAHGSHHGDGAGQLQRA